MEQQQPEQPVTRTEYRLVRVQGEHRQVCARGSEEYVRGSFTEFAAYGATPATAARFGKPPVTWEFQEVEVTEQVMARSAYTDADVELAREVMARRNAHIH